MWARIRALVIKEFLAILRDKASRVILVGPPLIQLVVFGYAATFNVRHIPYAVYNQDPGGVSRALLARFRGSPFFREVAVVAGHRQIAPLIDNKDALMVIHIGPRFSQDLLRHHPARIQVIVDGRNSNTASLALNDVNRVVEGFDASFASRHGWHAPPARLAIRAWFNPDLLSRWFIVPGIVGFLTLLAAMLTTGLSVARERENGTFDQLLVTPLGPVEILLGKTIPGFIIGILEGSVIVLAAIFWFGVPFTGSLVALYFGLAVFLLSAIGIGLMISSFAVTQQQGTLGVFLFTVPAVILSGFTTPIANMPKAVQYLTYVNPMRYFMVILRGVFLEGDGVGRLWAQYVPLMLISVASMAIASWLFRHRLS
ncbi:MAG: ABC transporter permease [Acidiferrobacteraceae bacterium]